MIGKSFWMALGFLLAELHAGRAQQKVENLIIVTTDGLRWQEVFNGMDSAIAHKAQFNQGDSAYIFGRYWSDDVAARRKKLFPFLWSVFAANGQLFGNVALGSEVSVANGYHFSYPGYNEIFTGYPDTAINTNAFRDNPNVNVLEYIQRAPGFKDKVAAFGSWEAYHRILNSRRCGFPVVAAFDTIPWKNPTSRERLIDAMKQASYKPEGEEGCMDVFTHFSAMEYLRTRRPRVLYVAYLETDEWAHQKMYRNYLDAAHHVDEWLRQFWEFLQADPQYRNNTVLWVTTDHGRGDRNKEKWTSHGGITEASQIWFGVMGPGLPARGEVRSSALIWQKQFAQTFAGLLGLVFTADHPVAEAIRQIW